MRGRQRDKQQLQGRESAYALLYGLKYRWWRLHDPYSPNSPATTALIIAVVALRHRPPLEFLHSHRWVSGCQSTTSGDGATWDAGSAACSARSAKTAARPVASRSFTSLSSCSTVSACRYAWISFNPVRSRHVRLAQVCASLVVTWKTPVGM